MNFLQAEKFDEESQTLVQSYFTFNVLMRTRMLLTSTFYILFIIDLVDYQQAAILISIGFIVQALIDYPTGVLAEPHDITIRETLDLYKSNFVD